VRQLSLPGPKRRSLDTAEAACSAAQQQLCVLSYNVQRGTLQSQDSACAGLLAAVTPVQTSRKGLPTAFSYKLTDAAGGAVNVSTAFVKSGKHYRQVSNGHFSSVVLSSYVCMHYNVYNYTRVLLHAQQY
jgi:hypothetical protein